MVSGARKIIIEGCKSSNATNFSKIGESKELAQRNAGLSQEHITITDPAPVSLIKLVIADGWDDFTSVHSLEVK